MKNTNKELKIEIPEGYEIDKQKSSFEKIVFKKVKPTLPTKWEDLKKIESYYISSNSQIVSIDSFSLNQSNYNVFSSKEEAEAALALAMLSQLKKVYNTQEDGSVWEPDWSSDSNKYIITFVRDTLKTYVHNSNQIFLAFKDAEIRDEFLENFRDLILKAKPLL